MANRSISSGQFLALVGTVGSPSSTNRYVTDDDPAVDPVVEATFVLIAGEVILIGHVLVVETTTGDAVLANALLSGAGYEVIGVALTGAAVGQSVTAVGAGHIGGVRFGSAPAESANGSLVYLDIVAGLGSLIPPYSVTASVTVVLGILQGANGASMAPAVMLNPQFVEINP